MSIAFILNFIVFLFLVSLSRSRNLVVELLDRRLYDRKYVFKQESSIEPSKVESNHAVLALAHTEGLKQEDSKSKSSEALATRIAVTNAAPSVSKVLTEDTPETTVPTATTPLLTSLSSTSGNTNAEPSKDDSPISSWGDGFAEKLKAYPHSQIGMNMLARYLGGNHAKKRRLCRRWHTIRNLRAPRDPLTHVCLDGVDKKKSEGKPCFAISVGIDNIWLFDDLILEQGCYVFAVDPSMIPRGYTNYQTASGVLMNIPREGGEPVPFDPNRSGFMRPSFGQTLRKRGTLLRRTSVVEENRSLPLESVLTEAIRSAATVNLIEQSPAIQAMDQSQAIEKNPFAYLEDPNDHAGHALRILKSMESDGDSSSKASSLRKLQSNDDETSGNLQSKYDKNSTVSRSLQAEASSDLKKRMDGLTVSYFQRSKKHRFFHAGLGSTERVSIKGGSTERISNPFQRLYNIPSNHVFVSIEQLRWYMAEIARENGERIEMVTNEKGEQIPDLQIDIFRMDCEGCEWEVLASWLKSGMINSVDQLLLEIHMDRNKLWQVAFPIMAGLLSNDRQLFWSVRNAYAAAFMSGTRLFPVWELGLYTGKTAKWLRDRAYETGEIGDTERLTPTGQLPPGRHVPPNPTDEDRTEAR